MLLPNATAILLQNAAEVYYKMCQFFIKKCDSFITKCNSYYKLRQLYYKMRRLLQIATVQTFTIHRTGGEGSGYLFNSSLPIAPASLTIRR